MRSLRILVVDDERPIVELVGEYLRARGHEVFEASDGESGWKRLAQGGIDVVLSDVKMPRLSGPELLDRIRTTETPVAVILMTGYATTQAAVGAMRAGAAGYLLKPFKLSELWSTIQAVGDELARRDRVVEVVGLGELLELARGAAPGTAQALVRRLSTLATEHDGVTGAALLLDQPACDRPVVHSRDGDLAGQDLVQLVETDCRTAPGLVLPLRVGDRTAGHLVALGTRQAPVRRALQACCDIVGEALRRVRSEHPDAFATRHEGMAAALGTLPEPARAAWLSGLTAKELKRDPSLVGPELTDAQARLSARMVLEALEGHGPLWDAVDEDLRTRSGAWLPIAAG